MMIHGRYLRYIYFVRKVLMDWSGVFFILLGLMGLTLFFSFFLIFLYLVRSMFEGKNPREGI